MDPGYGVVRMDPAYTLTVFHFIYTRHAGTGLPLTWDVVNSSWNSLGCLSLIEIQDGSH